jgi:hypothetical protein
MTIVEEKITLRRKMQPAVLFLMIFVIIASTIIFVGAGLKAQRWDVAIGMPALGLVGLMFNYLSDRGYSISYDEDRIYARDWGFRRWFQRCSEHSMLYSEIVTLEGKFKGMAGTKIQFAPFEFLELQSSNELSKEIWIYPPAFPDSDIKAFLNILHERRPDLFPDYVLQYMRSNKSL